MLISREYYNCILNYLTYGDNPTTFKRECFVKNGLGFGGDYKKGDRLRRALRHLVRFYELKITDKGQLVAGDERRVVVADDVNGLVKEMHEESGHLGINKLAIKIKRMYLGVPIKIINAIVKACEYCSARKGGDPVQRNKTRRPPGINSGNDRKRNIAKVYRPFEQVGVSVTTMEDEYGRRVHVLVAVDFFSRFMWAFVLSENTAMEVATTLYHLFLSLARTPESLHSDHSAEFINNVIILLMSQLRIKIKRAKSISSKPLGRWCRAIRTVKQLVEGLRHEHRDLQLEMLLLLATSKYNNNHHEALSTKSSHNTPAMALFPGCNSSAWSMVPTMSSDDAATLSMEDVEEIFEDGERITGADMQEAEEEFHRALMEIQDSVIGNEYRLTKENAPIKMKTKSTQTRQSDIEQVIDIDDDYAEAAGDDGNPPPAKKSKRSAASRSTTLTDPAESLKPVTSAVEIRLMNSDSEQCGPTLNIQLSQLCQNSCHSVPGQKSDKNALQTINIDTARTLPSTSKVAKDFEAERGLTAKVTKDVTSPPASSYQRPIRPGLARNMANNLAPINLNQLGAISSIPIINGPALVGNVRGMVPLLTNAGVPAKVVGVVGAQHQNIIRRMTPPAKGFSNYKTTPRQCAPLPITRIVSNVGNARVIGTVSKKAVTSRQSLVQESPARKNDAVAMSDHGKAKKIVSKPGTEEDGEQENGNREDENVEDEGSEEDEATEICDMGTVDNFAAQEVVDQTNNDGTMNKEIELVTDDVQTDLSLPTPTKKLSDEAHLAEHDYV